MKIAKNRKPVFAPVTLSEQDGVRYLHFDTPLIQGAMRISQPHELELEYCRAMMRWQEHIDEPAHIVQLGLGAGSLSKYCLKNFPRARVTAVEINPEVIAVAHQFFKLPLPSKRFATIEQDAALWVQNPRHAGCADIIQVDVYDAQAKGPVLDSAAFYAGVRSCLREGGIMTVNVFGNGRGFEQSYAAIAQAFGGYCYATEAALEGNRIVLALRKDD